MKAAAPDGSNCFGCGIDRDGADGPWLPAQPRLPPSNASRPRSRRAHVEAARRRHRPRDLPRPAAASAASSAVPSPPVVPPAPKGVVRARAAASAPPSPSSPWRSPPSRLAPPPPPPTPTWARSPKSPTPPPSSPAQSTRRNSSPPGPSNTRPTRPTGPRAQEAHSSLRRGQVCRSEHRRSQKQHQVLHPPQRERNDLARGAALPLLHHPRRRPALWKRPTTPPKSPTRRPRSPAKSTAPSNPTTSPATSNTSPTPRTPPTRAANASPAPPRAPANRTRSTTAARRRSGAKLTGLANTTTYHLRLVVSNAAGADTKEAARPSPPSPSTRRPSSPSTTPPTSSPLGQRNRQGQTPGQRRPRLRRQSPAASNTSPTPQFTATGFAGATAVPCEPATPFTDARTAKPTSPPPSPASAPSTTYHLRLAAENAAPAAGHQRSGRHLHHRRQSGQTDRRRHRQCHRTSARRPPRSSGEVERPAGADPALDVSCRFEYVTDQQFTEHGFENAGQAPCVGRNEVQSLTVAATAGQFRLTYGGQTTSDIRFNAIAEEVQEALRGMGVEVLVSGGPGDGAGSTPYRITFVGGLGEKDVAQIVATKPAPNSPRRYGERHHADHRRQRL